jgi:hypothetical protein
MKKIVPLMRAVGFVCILLGFAGLFGFNIFARATAIGLSARERARIPDKDSFSRNEVVDIVFKSNNRFFHGLPQPFWPAVLVLVGGIVLARATIITRTAQPDTAPNDGPATPVDNPDAPGGPPSVS